MRAILLNLTRLAGMQLVIALTGIIRNKVLALRLAPASYGEFSQLLVVAGLVYGLVKFGLAVGLSRNVAAAGTPAERQEKLATANFIVLALSVLAWVLVPLLIWTGALSLPAMGVAHSTWTLAALGLLLLLAPIEALQTNYLGFLEGVMDFKGVSSGRSLGVLVGTLVSVPIVWYGGMVGAVVQTALISVYLTWLLGRRCFQLGYRPLLVHWHGPSARVIGLLGLASLISGFAQNASDVAIRAALGRQLGAAQIGFYQAALSIAFQVKAIVLGGVGSYSLATLSQQGDREEISQTAVRLLQVVLPVETLALGVLGLVAYPLVYLLYTGSYTPAVAYFPVLLLADYLEVFVWVISAPLLGRGLTGHWLGLGLLYAGLRWLFTMLLLPGWGAQAVVLAYLMAMALHLLANLYVYRRVLGLWLSHAVWWQFGLGLVLILGAAAFGTSQARVAVNIGAAAIYGVLYGGIMAWRTWGPEAIRLHLRQWMRRS